MLKNIFLFLSLLSFASAMQITNDPAFQEIYTKKQNNDKITLMLYSAKTCPQCAYMKQKIFKDEKVNKYMKKHFVVLEKDINKDTLPEGFEYFGIPTMFFINNKGEQIGKIEGSSRANIFFKKLEKIIDGK